MFAIGETTAMVSSAKLKLPKEYNLRKKDRTIYGIWQGETLLYLSDEVRPLKAKMGRDKRIYKVNIDSKSNITVPSYLDNAKAVIRGCISTIEIEFVK